jgi:hypothetical protein
MRMPRSLGVVATAFLALGLGVGIGGAAFSNFASSGSGRVGAYAIGTSQWDDSNAKTAPEGVDPSFSERREADGQDHWKGARRQGARRSAESDVFVDDGGRPGGMDQANNNWADRSTSNVEAQQVSVFVPAGSGGVGHMAPSSDAKTAAEPSSHTGTDQKQKPGNVEGNGPKKGGPVAVSRKGTNKPGTHQPTRSEATTKQVHIYASISVRTTDSSVDVIQSNWARTTATSSNGSWTNRNHNPGPKVRGGGRTNVSDDLHSNRPDQPSASSTTTEHVNVYAPIAVGAGGDGDGHVHQDDSASTHSSSHGNHPGHEEGAGRWQVSRSDPGSQAECN